MEFKEYIRIIQKNLWLIAVSIILVAAFAYVYTARQPIIYEANSDLTIIPKSGTELKNVYEYDGYYALQSASLFGNTIISWFQSPDIVADIYQKSGVSVDNTSSKSLGKLIKASLVPNSFSVKFQIKDTNKERVLKLAKTTTSAIQNKTANFNQKSTTKVKFEIADSEPIIITVRPQKEFYTLVGALAGLILGTFFGFVFEYFRKS